MNCFRLRAWPRLVAAALLLLLLPMAAAMAQDDGDGGMSAAEAWFDRALAQGEGITTDWEGSVVGDVTARIGGRAKLHFFELENGRLKMQLYLGGHHQYNDGVLLGGVVSCARGTRTYPVWVRQRAGEDQPFGRLALMYTDGSATVSRRVGVSPPASHDIYEAESGRITLTLLEDRLAVNINAVMGAGPIREGSTEISPRIQLRAQSSVERTLENERLFDTSRCTGRAPFEVVSVKPEDGRANVLVDRPEILVELSRDVHAGSLRNPDLVVVRTLKMAPGVQPAETGYAPLGQQSVDQPWTDVPAALGDTDTLEERVTGKLDLKDSRTLRFTPDAPLRSGVRYQIDLAHGDGGIRSTNFHVLDEVPPSWFTTWVDPEEVRLHVYQTTRDAPLLQRKPSVARVYVDWDRHTDIHPDWQAGEVEIDLELTRNESQRAVLPVETHWVTRPDLLDDEDRRMARDSVNRFGWSPEGTDVRELVARVEPHDHWPADRRAPEVTGSRPIEYAARQVESVTVEAYIARMAEWRFELPPSETTADVIRAFQLDNEYARQVYPLLQVNGRFAGFFEPVFVKPSLDGAYLGSVWPTQWTPDRLRENYRTLYVQAKLLHDQIGRHSTADIVVGYYPPAFEDGKGKGILDNPAQQANVVLMPVKGMDGAARPAILDLPLVAHEYGHIFGLPHFPFVADDQQRLAACRKALYYQPSEGIEGFRIPAGGDHGWSKSSTTGNAQNADSLKNLMFPCIYDGRWMWWIRDVNYKYLVDTLPGVLQRQRAIRFAGLVPAGDTDVRHAVQMQRPSAARGDGRRSILVSGFTDGERSVFFPAMDVPSPDAGVEPDSPYRLVLEAEDGTELARRAVEDPGQDGPSYFSAALEVGGEPGRVLLYRGGTQIGELPAGAVPASPTVISHKDGDRLEPDARLRWQPAPGGSPLLYSVRYRAGPLGPVRVLAALTEQTELALDPAMLPHGDEPTLEVIAHSGLHESRTRLRVQLPDALRPMLVHPVGEMLAGDEGGIDAWFPAELVPDSLREGGARLLDASGAEVPVRAFVDPNGNGVRILPQAALVPGAQYTVQLAPGLAAVDGRVVSSAVRWSFRASAQSAEAAEMLLPQPPLPRAVTPLPPLPGSAGAEAASAAAERATGEATLIGTDAMQAPVALSVCETAKNPSARVLLDGRFGKDASSVRFRLERAAGDAVVLGVERQAANGRLSVRLQGALDRPGGGGLTVTEHQGHWNLSAMLDFEDGRKPLLMRVNCGLP